MRARVAYLTLVAGLLAAPASATEITRTVSCQADAVSFDILFLTTRDDQPAYGVSAGGRVAPAAIASESEDSTVFRVTPKTNMPQITLITLKASGAALVSLRERNVQATFGAQCEEKTEQGS